MATPIAAIPMKLDGNSARLVYSSSVRLKGWSLPTSRARATAGHESTASNSRFKLGKDPSGSSASFLTREARSSQPQAEMGSLATTTSRSLGALSCGVIELPSTVLGALREAASLAAIPFGLDHRGVQPCH